MDPQLGTAPVREPGRMGKDMAGGDLAGIPVGRVTRQVFVERLVEVEFPGVNQLKHSVREERLTQGGGFKDGRVIHRLVGLAVFHAETALPDQLAVAEQANR